MSQTSQSQSQSSSNSDDAPTFNDYIEELVEHLADHIPPQEADPNRTHNRLLGMFMDRNNKRNLTLCIQTVGSNLLRVKYGMPVPEAASRMFLPVGEAARVLPPTHYEFTAHPGQANFALACDIQDPDWDAELNRLMDVRDANQDGSPLRQRAMNILRYWYIMRRKVVQALQAAGVVANQQGAFHMSSSASESASSGHRNSSNRRTVTRRSSSARRSSGSRTFSSRRTASNNRSSSNGQRQASQISQRSQSRRRSRNRT
jgi:hypothetical protein